MKLQTYTLYIVTTDLVTYTIDNVSEYGYTKDRGIFYYTVNDLKQFLNPDKILYMGSNPQFSEQIS